MYIAQTSQNTPDFLGQDGDWAQHNAGVTPHFYIDKITCKEPDGTVRKNFDGTAMVLEIECVTIVVAGDTLTEASQPVDDQIRERFAIQYQAWKAGRDLSVGTPLSDCQFLNARQAVYLEANNIFSIEDLAALSDSNVVSVMDGRELRDKAHRWLKKKGATDLAAENQKIHAELAAIKKELQAERAEREKKRKRPPMPQEQRDKIAASTKSRWAAVAAAAGKVLPEA